MIDCENEVYSRVAAALRSEFPGIDISGDEENLPSSFPHASIVQANNTTVPAFTGMDTEMIEVMYEVNVYSNETGNKKTQCKNIMGVISDVFFGMNFRRMSLNPVDNRDDITIYRLTARFRGRTDGTYFYRS